MKITAEINIYEEDLVTLTIFTNGHYIVTLRDYKQVKTLDDIIIKPCGDKRFSIFFGDSSCIANSYVICDRRL